MLSFNIIFGQNPNILVWGEAYHVKSNAFNLITAHDALGEYKDRFLKKTYWNEKNWKGKTMGVGYRIAKSVLFDIQLDYLTYIIQHEVYGHGSRYREFGLRRNSYKENLPP